MKKSIHMDTIVIIPYHVAFSQRWMLALFFQGEIQSKVKIRTEQNTLMTYDEFFASFEEVPEIKLDEDICSMDLSSEDEV